MKKKTNYLILLFAMLLFTPFIGKAQFTAGNLALVQADASAANTTCSVLEINTTSAGQSPINSFAIPGTGANAIRVSGSATSTLYASNSNDGSLFCFTGANNTDAASNVNTLNPRAVVTINNSGSISVITTYTGGSGNQTRGATSLNNTNWFIGDQGGVYTNSSTSASPSGNYRAMKAFGGIVYSQSTATVPIGTVATPSGATLTALTGLTASSTNLQDFYLVSSGSNGSTYDILYLIYASSATAGTIQKYSLVSGSWTSNGTYTTSFGGFGITAKSGSGNASLFVTTGTGATTANSVRKLTDANGYNTTISITDNGALYTAPTGKIIKGIAFAPTVATSPSINTSSSSLTFSSTIPTQSSASQTVNLTGANLTGAPGNITVTSPSTDFQVSNNNSTWNSSTTISYSSATLSSTPVYIRFTPQSSGSKSGNVTFSGGGASTTNIAVSGTGSAVPTKLVITNITPSTPTVGSTFSVTIQAQDASSTLQNVTSNTNISLAVATGSGALSGTITGTINSGSSSVTLSGLLYSVGETGVSVTASTTSGMSLTSGTSSTFTVTGIATLLKFTNIPTTGLTSTIVSSFKAKALRSDSTTDANYTGNITISKLSGPGNMTGTTTIAAVAGSATYADIQFDQPGTYTLSATASGLATATSSSITVTNAPALSEVILPQYIQGLNGTNSNRIPYSYRASLNNLIPNATYRYYNEVVISTDVATADGAGNCIFASASGFSRTSGPSMSSAGNYGTFVTDANGSFTGWFVNEPTGNARFTPGNTVNMRIMLNDGLTGTSVATRLTTTSGVQVINLATDAANGTALAGTSSATAKNFIFTYDNVNGTGRPISGSFVESDGVLNTTANSYASFYSTSVDGVVGAYGVIIPNTNANGVRRIEQRNFASGSVVGCAATDADGVWASGANTVNPTGGATAITITPTDATLYPNSSSPVITSITNATTICSGSNLNLNVTATGSSSFNYAWTGSGTFSSTSVANPTITNASSGAYTVVVSNTCGSTSANVAVTVNSAPQISCPSTLTLNAASGTCANIATFSATATGAPTPSITYSQNSGTSFSVGTTVITSTATNSCGTSSCNFNVVVNDNEIPSITAPANVTVNSGSNCNASNVNLGTPVTADNCGVATVTNNAPSVFAFGNTNVIWTVTDVHGNTNTATQTVTVNDNIAPTITAPANVTVNSGSNCNASNVNLGTPVTADNCGVATVTNNAPSVFAFGNTNVIWTVTDVHGNTNTATQIVTVNDNSAPIILGLDSMVVSVNADSCTAVISYLGSPEVSDNCSEASITNNAPATYHLGNNFVTWTATDANGNVATYTQKIIVIDNEAPSITAPSTIIVNTDSNTCTVSLINLGTPLTSDNCGIANITNDAPSIFPIGSTVVKWTAVDNSGNTNFDYQTIIVIDGQWPTLSGLNNITVNTDGNSCFATNVNLGTPITNDNCGIASITNDAPSQYSIGTTNVTWIVTDVNENSSSYTQTVTVNGITNVQTPIVSGPTTICSNVTSATYTTPALTGALSYNWTVPTGVNVVSGTGTNSLTVSFGSSFTSGQIMVSATYACQTSATGEISIVKTAIPSTPGTITGSAISCGTTSATYSVVVVPNASTYLWQVPTGMTITSGQGTNSIIVSVVSTFNSGNVIVTAYNSCNQASVARSFMATASHTAPAAPAAIKGIATVCAYIGSGSVTYSVVAVTNATSYTWTVPTGATIVSGQGTSSIDVTYSSAFTTGSVSVKSVNTCGNSAAKTLAITKTLPATPGVITGTTNVCAYVGSGTVSYSIAAVTNASSYTWTVPTGASIVSGQGTTSISVAYSQSFVPGNITVKSTANCGSSAAKTLAVTRTLPMATGTITGPTNACLYVNSPNTATYTVATVITAASYNWTVPTGATIVSGQGTNTIHVSYSSSFTPGNITVQSVANCGMSAAKTLAIVKTNPTAPTSITGPTAVCGLNTASYSTATVTTATSYNWVVPNGITIASGQGTNNITVDISGTFTGGNISVASANGCATSAAKTLALTTAPTIPGTISGTANVCSYAGTGNNVTYSIAAVSNATSYTWTVPANSSIVSGQGTTSIEVSYASNFASGNIGVKSVNACSTSIAKTIAITKTKPATPATITGPASVCGLATANYSIANVTAATSYNWSVPVGANIISGQGTNAITVSIDSNFASGNVTVTAANPCGISLAKTIAISNCPIAARFAKTSDNSLDVITTSNNNTMFTVYPNPTSTGSFSIDYTTETESEIVIEVYGVTGNLILNNKYNVSKGNNSIATEIESFERGVYLVRLIDTKTNYTNSRRLIKQ